MKKINIIILMIAVITLSACSTQPTYWEREKLTSNLELTGKRAKTLLDIDIAECTTITKNRETIERETRDTKRCTDVDGADWKAESDETFLKQCMKRRGWIPSNCCAFNKNCACD